MQVRLASAAAAQRKRSRNSMREAGSSVRVQRITNDYSAKSPHILAGRDAGTMAPGLVLQRIVDHIIAMGEFLFCGQLCNSFKRLAIFLLLRGWSPPALTLRPGKDGGSVRAVRGRREWGITEIEQKGNLGPQEMGRSRGGKAPFGAIEARRGERHASGAAGRKSGGAMQRANFGQVRRWREVARP
jgi:hypothetical protein